MTKDEYGDFVLRYRGCGACFPMYHTLSRFEKMWFTAIQKDIADLEKENAELKADNDARKFAMTMSENVEKQLREENAKLKTDYEVLSCSVGDFGELQDKLEEEQRKNNGLSDNLTKAEELLKHWVNSYGGMDIDLCNKSQNFIDEVKK